MMQLVNDQNTRMTRTSLHHPLQEELSVVALRREVEKTNEM